MTDRFSRATLLSNMIIVGGGMDKERLIQNSVANRIVQTLFLKGDMTTLEIQKNISDVSQATVYRYVKLLEQHGFLRVSKEEKIRGQIEKTYCIEEISISKSDNSENSMKSVDLFLKKIRGEYQFYFTSNNSPVEDRLFLQQVSFVLSDEEYDDFCGEIKEVLKKYAAREKTNERRVRNLYMLSAPGEE